MKAQYFTISLFSLLLNMAYGNDPPHSGLFFSSHEVNQELRTSLNLTPTTPFCFPNGFSIEFEANFRNKDGYFGYVYRIIGDEENNIDLVVNLNTTKTAFWLVAKDTILIPFTWEEIGGRNFQDWLSIRMDVDASRNEVKLTLNGREKSSTLGLPTTSLQKLEFLFGAHKTKKFVSTDVAPMKIKNIHITELQGKQRAFWKMDKHQNNTVYDEISGLRADVSNPSWEIDRHTSWKQLLDISIPNKFGTAVNQKDSKFYIIGTDELFTIDLAAETIVSSTYKKGNPYNCLLNTFVFDPETNSIISYSFEHSAPSILDLETLTWSLEPEPCDLPNYWHHNRIYQNNTLTTFGGYGLYTFKNQIQRLDLKSQTWTTLSFGDIIEPRYLSAIGQLSPNEIYIFGGYGSKSGAQHLDPHNYYDLHKIDLNSGHIVKFWDRTRQLSHHFVPVEALIPTVEKDGFYTLIFDKSKYNTHLNLVKILLDSSEMIVYTDSIPYNFRDIESWSSLYNFEESQRLIALTMSNNKLSLHELAFPPLMPEDTYQESIPTETNSLRMYALLFILLTGILLVIIWIINKQKKKDKTPQESESEEVSIAEKVFIRHKVSTFYFVGGFQAFDKNGKNITSDFTPTLRQLFLIIYFYSVKDKGITSSKLKELIWPDKSDLSAKNNRNVNICKLRLILEKTGQIHIDSEDSYWKISLSEQIYSDYEEILSLIEHLNSNRNLPHEKIIRLINLLSMGELCPNIQTDWMDNFKVSFSNLAIDTLMNLLNGGIISENQYNLRICVAETLLIHDVLNEEAIKIKCQALVQMGKKGLALQAYEKFSREYEKMMGVPYPETCSILIKS